MIDSHCHIAGEEFVDDLDAVVERAQSAGVTGALCILAADDEQELARAARVRERWRAVRFAVGIHPHQAGVHGAAVAQSIDGVRQRVETEGACAIGEIGLDYHYDFAPRDVQQAVFRAQIRLALELSLPIVIHTREATDDTFAILEDEGGNEVGGVFHCFTGDAAMASRTLDAGFHVSFAGIVTFPRAEALREAARIVPGDRLLVETDSPYLAPVPHRGTRNEPAHVVRVVDTLARVRGEDAVALAGTLTRTYDALFSPLRDKPRSTNGLAR
jgi:TatD DNase family protein